MSSSNPERSVSYLGPEVNQDKTDQQDVLWTERLSWVIIAALFMAAFLGVFS